MDFGVKHFNVDDDVMIIAGYVDHLILFTVIEIIRLENEIDVSLHIFLTIDINKLIFFASNNCMIYHLKHGKAKL